MARHCHLYLEQPFVKSLMATILLLRHSQHTYVLSVQRSCGVVSVFWLWREMVLKMRTHFYKKILLGYYDPIADVCIY